MFGMGLHLSYSSYYIWGFSLWTWLGPVVLGIAGAVLPVVAGYVGWALRELAKSHEWLAQLIVAAIAAASWCGLVNTMIIPSVSFEPFEPFVSSEVLEIYIYAGGTVLFWFMIAVGQMVSRKYRIENDEWK